MPTGTKVDEVYQALLKKGYSKGKAARIAQSQTGTALATGKPPKHAVKAANEPPEDLTTPSSSRVTPSPGNKVLKELREGKVTRQNPEQAVQATTPVAADVELMRPNAEGIFECSRCHYRADGPRPHNCERILNQQHRNGPGWSGFHISR